MVLNLRRFFSSTIEGVIDEKGNLIFDLFEVEEVVDAVMAETVPQLTAANWSVGGKTKHFVNDGMEQHQQVEIASMTKICTAYCVCNILKEMGNDSMA